MTPWSTLCPACAAARTTDPEEPECSREGNCWDARYAQERALREALRRIDSSPRDPRQAVVEMLGELRAP